MRKENFNESKKISILTPIFNGLNYLEECVASVLEQDYKNIEHVFADGGSTDGTIDRLEELSVKYPDRIKYFVAHDDQGVGSGLQRAYDNCSGELIGWLDSDDRYEPYAISRVVHLFTSNPEYDFIYGNCNIMNAKSEIIGEFVIRPFDKWEWINRWHYIVFCATFFKREVVEKVGFVNNLGNDVDFYLRVNKEFKLEKVDTLFSTWRLHDGGISLSGSKRETSIRRNRAKEDFLIVIKNRGDVLSPKALNYLNLVGSAFFNRHTMIWAACRTPIRFIRRIVGLSIAGNFTKHEGSFTFSFLKLTVNLIKRKIRYFVYRVYRILKRKMVQIGNFGRILSSNLKLVCLILKHVAYYVHMKWTNRKRIK
jgi:glycosyltransferase involved in cell wall biosynthesis